MDQETYTNNPPIFIKYIQIGTDNRRQDSSNLVFQKFYELYISFQTCCVSTSLEQEDRRSDQISASMDLRLDPTGFDSKRGKICIIEENLARVWQRREAKEYFE